ncbi:uncharacterized protein VTP21DRAFT_9766 [Calcarisporiella thermophila]|uniref:uncharacterized protein n=1 Tax=Calcarisporiella thermophila TaxID=911321 RepID=UPI003742B03B
MASINSTTSATYLLEQYLIWIVKDIDKWAKFIAPNAIVELPYAETIGLPTRLEGIDSIYNAMRNAISNMHGAEIKNLRILPVEGKNAAIGEFELEATNYQQRYISYLEAKDGLVTYYKGYFNPMKVVEAFGDSVASVQNKAIPRAKIAVAGPAGNIGRVVAEKLVEAGVPVVLLGLERHRARLSDLIEKGAQFEVAGFDDEEALIKALQGCDSLFWLSPPNPTAESLEKWYLSTAKAAAQAIKKNGISRVVNITTVGVGAKPNLGNITVLADVERVLDEVAPNVLHLRPGYFMENLLWQKDSLANEGVFRLPFQLDHDIPWISTDDIGVEAAKYLLDRHWAGHWTKNLMGPENLTCPQVADRLSKALNRPITYEQIPISALQESLKEDTPQWIDEIVTIYKSVGDPDGIYATARTPEAATPTTMSEFALRKLSDIKK